MANLSSRKLRVILWMVRGESGRVRSRKNHLLKCVRQQGLRDQLLGDIRNGEHSEYERGLLRANVAKVYLEMIGSAYGAASIIEVSFLELNAGLVKMCMGEDDV